MKGFKLNKIHFAQMDKNGYVLPDLNDALLCVSHDQEIRAWIDRYSPSYPYQVRVTILRQEVTCQDCKEWLHA